MFNFRLFAVCIVLALAFLAVYLVSQATDVRPIPTKPASLSREERLLRLLEMNEPDEVGRGQPISPLRRVTSDEAAPERSDVRARHW